MNIANGSQDCPLLDADWQYRQHGLTEDDDVDEYSDTEEVTYLVLDTISKIKASELLDSKELQISGLNTKKPVVRIGTHIFEGQYENLIGTEMLLSEIPTVDAGPSSYYPAALTKSHVRLAPITLIPKEPAADLPAAFLVNLPHPGPPLPASLLKAKSGVPRGRPRKDGQPQGSPYTKTKKKGSASASDATVLLPPNEIETEEFDFGDDANTSPADADGDVNPDNAQIAEEDATVELGI